jgi:sugar phosphate isomerase/epimerase
VNGISTGAYEPERDDWGDAIARARREGFACVELCAILPPLVETLAAHLAARAPDGFARVSLHAPVGIASTDAAIAEVVRLPLDGDVILHPDLYGRDDAAAALGPRAVFENMDVAKSFGRTVDDLAEVFARFPDAGFCLDVAHVWTNDRSVALGHDLLDAFGDRLRQLHVSGIEPDGTHRETTAADLELYRPLLERAAHVPHVYEAVVV